MIEKVSVAWNRQLSNSYSISDTNRLSEWISYRGRLSSEHGIMWLYHVSQKDDRGFYVSNKAGIWLGQLKGKEADEPELITRVIDFMRDMSFYDFLIKHHDWTMDYDFHFVEAVS